MYYNTQFPKHMYRTKLLIINCNFTVKQLIIALQIYYTLSYIVWCNNNRIHISLNVLHQHDHLINVTANANNFFRKSTCQIAIFVSKTIINGVLNILKKQFKWITDTWLMWINIIYYSYFLSNSKYKFNLKDNVC